MDTRTGRAVWQKNVCSGRRYVVKVGVDRESCYVVCFESTGVTRVTTVTKLALIDGKHLWTAQLPRNYQGREIFVAADTVVLSGLTWSRRGNRFTPGGGQVCIHDKDTGKLVQVLNAQKHGGGITGIGWSMISRVFATGDGRLCVLSRGAIAGYASKK